VRKKIQESLSQTLRSMSARTTAKKLGTRMSASVRSLIACSTLGFVFMISGCGGDSDTKTVAVPDGDAAKARTGSATPISADVTDNKIVKDAIECIKKRQFADAVKLLNQAIESDDQCAEAYFQRAGILADARRDTNALEDYSKAVELAPNNVRFLNMKGLFLLTRSQLTDAAKDFAKAVELDPKYVQAYNNLGLVKLAEGDYQQSIDDFNTALKLDENYVDGYNNRGFAWYQAGNDERALADFNRTLQLNSEYVNAYNNRGMLAVRMKDYEKAIADFSSAIRLDSRNAKHYRNRQAAYREIGLKGRAKADGDRVTWLLKLHDLNNKIARSPQRAENYIQKASHLADAGEREIALATFEQALQIQPDNPDALVSRAEFWLSNGDIEKAIADCNAVIDAAKKTGDWSHSAYSVRGDAYVQLAKRDKVADERIAKESGGKKDLQLAKYDRAIADFTAAKRLDSGVAEAYYYRAIIRRNKGDQDGFQADLIKVRQLDPSLLR
jgi:tetratricopeptide (TPR) repeat protein